MVNSHKDAIVDKDVPKLLRLMAKEVREFEDEIYAAQGQTPDPNALEELADIGNFCFLLYQYLRDKGIKNATEAFLDEYYDIRPDLGRVYCRKRRSGSRLRPGDEVIGIERNRRVFIRAQHAITGAVINIPRSHLIWWRMHGVWPVGTLRYQDEIWRPGAAVTKDCIDNLQLTPPKSDGRLPFVSQYRPKGREGSANFGKWVYQRRHAFKLVRCGYYDTAEEAATEGLRAWKEKTRRV
jgi:hypothetical protein